MHVRIAWEFYHQTKQNSEKIAAPSFGVKPDMLRPPSHMFPPPGGLQRPHELPPTGFPTTSLQGRPAYDQGQLGASFLGGPPSHLGGFFL